jgi:hypothetical protein
MLAKRTTNNVIVSLYSNDLRLMAQVIEEDGTLYVDFYRDEILLDSRRIEGHSVQYAQDIAENYTLGVLKIDSKTWRVNGV